MSDGEIDNSEAVALISEARCKIGITEYEMCKRAGIGQGSFSNVKRNRRRLRAEMARKLAYALELPMVRLFELAGILPRDGSQG